MPESIELYKNDSDTTPRVFYLNKEKAARVLNEFGQKLPNRNMLTSGLIHNIHDPNSPVKMKKAPTPVLYITEDIVRANEFLKPLRLQLPSGHPTLGSIGNVTYSKDGVNTKADIQWKTFSELEGTRVPWWSGRYSICG